MSDPKNPARNPNDPSKRRDRTDEERINPNQPQRQEPQSPSRRRDDEMDGR